MVRTKGIETAIVRGLGDFITDSSNIQVAKRSNALVWAVEIDSLETWSIRPAHICTCGKTVISLKRTGCSHNIITPLKWAIVPVARLHGMAVSPILILVGHVLFQ